MHTNNWPIKYRAPHLISGWPLWKVCPGWGNVQTFIIIWDNVAFDHACALTEWFEALPKLMSHFLPPYSPFLNPIVELFSTWNWKVYDHCPQDQMSLLKATNAACQDISVEDWWIRHSKSFWHIEHRCELELVANSRGPGWLALVYIFIIIINAYIFYTYVQYMHVFFRR